MTETPQDEVQRQAKELVESVIKWVCDKAYDIMLTFRHEPKCLSRAIVLLRERLSGYAALEAERDQLLEQVKMLREGAQGVINESSDSSNSVKHRNERRAKTYRVNCGEEYPGLFDEKE